jgi:hypothetical protein
MTRTLLLSILFLTSTSFAADSTILREIMGKSVYEESGIVGLTAEQLQVLEKWILENAVETRMVQTIMPRLSLLGIPAVSFAGRGYTWVIIGCKYGRLMGQYWVQFNNSDTATVNSVLFA